MNRRRLLSVAATAMIGIAGRANHAAAGFRSVSGCYIAPSEFDELMVANLPPDQQAQPWDPAKDPIIGHSHQGERFDQELGGVLVMMRDVFDVTPGFGFYDDSAGMNALAAPVNRVPNTSGTVVFGLGMLDDQMKRNGDIAIAAICAHEFGHVFQYAAGYYQTLQRQLPRYCTELHADFLAGYFLRLFAAQRPKINLKGVEQAWSRLGSSDFNRPGTHGTNQQRQDAITAGYFFLDRSSPSIDAAADAALEHVRRYG